ncbi:PH domain-containing protein [Mycolicibacterium smegmatis]|uniref:Low molecular weight protein antigen 6 n=2 Tax=Mycolicibacterium smegmatis TaxID=1772 RepID=A0QUX5_MYCS2|nr:Low molecular weight protein antigen 6 [Mycolicibacterium smegmatis MC2 155]TBM41788.1 PH domain-containing protein [Mycolicibacterium smegmatis]TBH45572.1 PH domain-containing protein [Mycolicibacterium smegmatis MC2 155]TBM50972.1 PH domain-containing protein [Mycolicibacterium smegmatis]TBM64248.1 PH domain-containing protein [Mycolicibacterium smegmatis]
MSARSATDPVVIRISPMAHLAVAVVTLGLLTVILTNPPLFGVLLLIPIGLSLAIIRLQTKADRNTVTARSLLGSQTVPWSDIEGLRFERGRWAVAQRTTGEDLRLPAVTFATLPLLAEVSGGRVPNPYA